MSYANQYGAKYDVPIFGNYVDDDNDVSPIDLAAKLSGNPVTPTPAQDTGVLASRPQSVQSNGFADAIKFVMNYGSGAGLLVAGARKLEDLLRPAAEAPLSVLNAPAKIARPIAEFSRNVLQAASPQQDLVDVTQMGIRGAEKIFGVPQTPALPKLENFADKSEIGATVGGAGAFTGELVGMLAAIMSGTTAIKALEVPALARSVSTIPGIGGAIAKVAPWLGAETLGGAVGAGLGNAAYSLGNEARSVVEGKEELGHVLTKTALQGIVGTAFGGAASPTTSLRKKILGEFAINEVTGVVPAAYDAVTGRTTWLPKKTPTAEAIAKLNAAKLSGDADAIALAAGEADRTATHTFLGALNSVAGQAVLNGVAGALLPIAGAGLKKASQTFKGKVNPVATPTGAAPVSEAAASTATEDAIANAQAAQNFVRNTFKTRDDIAKSGMGANRNEITATVIAQMEQNPAVAQVIKDVNAGARPPQDYFATVRGEQPTVTPEAAPAPEPAMQEPVVQEPVVQEPTAAAPETAPVQESISEQQPVVEQSPVPESVPLAQIGTDEVIDLTPERIGQMSPEELSQHFDIAPAPEVVPNVAKTAETPAPTPEPPPPSAESVAAFKEVAQPERLSKVIDGVRYELPEPFVKIEGNTAIPLRPDVLVGKPTTVQFNKEFVPGYYVFHSADLALPAHVNGRRNERNFLGNPQGKEGQPAIDYVGGILMANEPNQMLGTDKNAFQNAPKVLLPTGEPVQGNTRAEVEQKLYEPQNAKQLAAYKALIMQDAEHYGLDTPEKIAAFNAMKNPTVSRVIDVDRATAARLLDVHQDEAAWTKSPADNSILRLSSMDAETQKRAVRMIAAGLEGEDGNSKTLLQLLRKEDYQKDMALLLAGPNNQKKFATYMDSADDNRGARAILDDLRNIVFGTDQSTIRKFYGLTNKQKEVVNSNIGQLLRLHDDELFADFKHAIDGLQRYNAEKLAQGKGLDNWFKGTDAFGIARSEEFSPGAQQLMHLIDENPPSEVKTMLNEYLDIRKNTSGESLFGEEPVPYSEMFRRAIAKANSGRLLGLTAPVVGEATGEAGASFFEDDKEYAGIKGSTIKDALRTLGLAAGMIATVHAMGGGKMLKIITKRGEEVTVKPLPEGTKIINGFYSPIEKMLRETKQEKNSAAKWLSMIGKGDEAKYTGLRAKLEAMKPNEQVSKADLLAHLDENRIVPVEVVKGELEVKGKVKHIIPDKWVEVKGMEGTLESADGRYVIDFEPELAEQGIPPYSLFDNVSNRSARSRFYTVEEAKRGMHELPTDVYKHKTRDGGSAKWEGRSFNVDGKFGGLPQQYKERLVILPGEKKFKSMHWEEPNVLVHTRSSIRNAIGGKKVLLVEEIQSDWGQSGRDKWWAADGGDGTQEAPFVTETAATTKLAAKYLLQDAVESNVDYVTWTSGNIQNERNALTKVADTIVYDKINNKLGRLITYKDGYVQYKAYVSSDKDLEAHIGKELSAKLLAQPSKDHRIDDMSIPSGAFAHIKHRLYENAQVLSGAEMEVGGGPMKAFYGEPATGNIGLVGQVIESIVGKGAVKTFGGLHGIEMTPAIRAQAQVGLSLFNIGGALAVPDNDEPIYPGASITNRDMRLLLGTAGVAALASHPQITGFVRKMLVSAPETALREIGKVEPTIMGYAGKKLDPTKLSDADVVTFAARAKADGITDELLAHHKAFMDNAVYSRDYLEQSRAELYGNVPDVEAEQAASDYLLKQIIHAHNTGAELPEMSNRLHTLATSTLDGAEGVVGKNDYVQSNASISDPAAAHIATVTQGREQSLGIQDVEYKNVGTASLDNVNRSSEAGWENNLYVTATGGDEVLQSALKKMDEYAILSPEEHQAWQKFVAEKAVWDDSIAKSMTDGDASGIKAIRESFRDPIRADAFDNYVSQKGWEMQMDDEVNAIAKENGFEPVKKSPTQGGYLYSSILPIDPRTWQAVKNSRAAQITASTAFGYVSGNVLFDDDKMYGPLTGKEAKLLMTASFGGMVGAAHIGHYFFPKLLSPVFRNAVHNQMHPVTGSVALHDIENVAAKKFGRNTPEFKAEVERLQAKKKRIDKGIGNQNIVSASWMSDVGHEEFSKVIDTQIKAQNSGRRQKHQVDLLHKTFRKFSKQEQDAATRAAALFDYELGKVRANKELKGTNKDIVVEQVREKLYKTVFAGNEKARKAFDHFQEMAAHARQIDVESRLMKKFGVTWEELPDKISNARALEASYKARVQQHQAAYAIADTPAVKSKLVKEIRALNQVREGFDTYATQLEFMRDLPNESQKFFYLPHFWDKPGKFKYSIHGPNGEEKAFRKFETQKEADAFIAKFRADAAAGLHKDTAVRVASTNFVRGARDIRLTINDLVAAAYSEKTATLAHLGLNREALLKGLSTLDEWTDLSEEARAKIVATLDENITPETLRHILNEMWTPRDVHLEYRKMRTGYLDVDLKKVESGNLSSQERKVLHDWVFGGLDKMITGGRLTLEKSAMLKEATEQIDELTKEGLGTTKYVSWLKDIFVPSLTNTHGITAKRSKLVGNIRSAISMSKLAGNVSHGIGNIVYGSIATGAEAAIQLKGNVPKAAWYMMTAAVDLPTGGKFSSPEIQKGIKLLEQHDYGETQFYNQALRSEIGNNELVKKFMFASVKSEEFNNKMSSIVFLKTALNKGATVEEAVEYALRMRQTTQFAFTPWMTTEVERRVRRAAGGFGSVGLTLMGAAIRGAEHTLSVYYRAAADPKKAFLPAMAMLTATTMISGLYGDPWIATGMRTIELLDKWFGDDDDTKLTKESTLEKFQRHVGDIAAHYGLPREKGENLWLKILRGIPAQSMNVNMSLDNNLSGMLSPVAISHVEQIIGATEAIVSDKSWQEKALAITKPVTTLNRITRAGLSMQAGRRVDSKGQPMADAPYKIGNAVSDITTGTPADIAFAGRAKAAKGGDLHDQYSKEAYVKTMYGLPGLRVGNEKQKSGAQFERLVADAPALRRDIQTKYSRTEKERAEDLQKAVAWARKNPAFMNWYDRNGGADLSGNLPAKALPALERAIENWYTAQAAALAANERYGPKFAKFSAKKGAYAEALSRIQESAAQKANTAAKKAEIRKLFVELKK